MALSLVPRALGCWERTGVVTTGAPGAQLLPSLWLLSRKCLFDTPGSRSGNPGPVPQSQGSFGVGKIGAGRECGLQGGPPSFWGNLNVEPLP